MNAITVRQLLTDLAKLVKKDASILDKEIYLSDDEEGNGYHGAYYSVTSNPDTIKECLDVSYGCREGEVDPHTIVILG